MEFQEARNKVQTRLQSFRDAHLKAKHPLWLNLAQTRRLIAAFKEAQTEAQKVLGDDLIGINVFGSRAKGYARPKSDVEFVVYRRPVFDALDRTSQRALDAVHDVLQRHGFQTDRHLSVVDWVPGEHYPKWGSTDFGKMFLSVPIVGKRRFVQERLKTLEAMLPGPHNEGYRSQQRYYDAVNEHAFKLSSGITDAKVVQRMMEAAVGPSRN